MSLDAFALKIQRELCHPKRARKVSGLSRNGPLVCFGARSNSYGSFTAPITGNLVAVKLVHQFGYVSCHVHVSTHWSFWAVERINIKGLTRWSTQSSPTTTITSLCHQRSSRRTLVALNGTRSLDITRNPLRWSCHVFLQLQYIEERSCVCGMVKIRPI